MSTTQAVIDHLEMTYKLKPISVDTKWCPIRNDAEAEEIQAYLCVVLGRLVKKFTGESEHEFCLRQEDFDKIILYATDNYYINLKPLRIILERKFNEGVDTM